MKNDINQAVIVQEANGTLLLTDIPASTVKIGEVRTINYCFRRIEVTIHSVVDYDAAPEIVRGYNSIRIQS